MKSFCKTIIVSVLILAMLLSCVTSIFAEESFTSQGVLWPVFYHEEEKKPLDIKFDEYHVETEATTGPSGPEVVEYYEYKEEKVYAPGSLSGDVNFDYIGKGLYYDGTDFYFFTDVGILATNFMYTIDGQRYFFGEDGKMVKNELINYDGELYFFDESGVMYKDQWLSYEELDEETNKVEYVDYYFGPTGRAYKADTSNSSLIIKTIEGEKYGFDEDGVKVEGYYDYQGNKYDPEEIEAYAYCDYYFDPDDNGVATKGWWYYDGSIIGDEYDSEEEIMLYFDERTCRKVKSNSTDESRCIGRYIEGQRYMFDHNGVRKNKWYTTEPGRGTYSNAKYFNDDEDGYLQKGWFEAIPGKNCILKENRDKHDSTDTAWFYATKAGNILRKTIRKIGNYTYAFDDDGCMVQDAMVKVKDGSFIKSYPTEYLYKANILYDVDEYGQADTGSMDTIANDKGLLNNGEQWMYFLGDSQGDNKLGSMCKANTPIRVELKDFDIDFYSSSLGGYTNKNTDEIVIRNNKFIQNGVLLKPDKDENKYGIVRKSKETKKLTSFVNYNNQIIEHDESSAPDIYTYVVVNPNGSPLTSSYKVMKDKDNYYIYVGKNGEFIGKYSCDGKNAGTDVVPRWRYKDDTEKVWKEGLPPENFRISDKDLWLNFDENGFVKGPTEDGLAAHMYDEP